MGKIIFLDIDGVLNSNFWNDAHQKEISDGTLVDENKVELLRELVQNTGAEIVLHSGWRFWLDENLRPLRTESARLLEIFQRYGLRISDVTPDYTTEEIRETKRFSLIKAEEILGWLGQHPEAEDWIVIDDLDLHNELISRRQVKTDQTIGLTRQDIETAENLLYLHC